MAATIQSLEEMVSDIVRGNYITADHMQRFNRILQLNSEYEPLSAMAIQAIDSLEPVRTPHLQVMFSGNVRSEESVGHWKVIYHNGQQLYVYDSFNTNILSPLEHEFLDAIFPDLPRVPTFVRVQEQQNGIDCGVFAIANATTLALGHDPALQNYIVPEMRPNLANMFMNNQLLRFPTTTSPSTSAYGILNQDEFPPLPNLNVSKVKMGRPKKVKKGRPKTSNLSSKEQHREAVKRYSQTNPEVHREAVQRYSQSNPEVNKEAVKRYNESNPEVHREAVKRFSLANPEVNRKAVKRYNESNPQVHREASKRFIKANPQKNRDAVKRHQQEHPENHLAACKRYRQTITNSKKISPSITTQNQLVGEYSGSSLETVKLFSLKTPSLFSNKIFSCSFCHSKLFFEESSRKKWCCSEGAYIVPALSNLEPDFYSAPHFLKNSRSYNNLFAFSALGVSHGFQHPKQGISFLKIQGRTYHRVFDLAYNESTNPCGMYIDDGETRLNLATERKLDLNLTEAINDYLINVNPFIGLLKKLSEEPSEDAHLIFENTSRRTHGPILGDVPRSSEIAAIISTERDQFNPKQIVIWKIGAKKPHTVDVFHPLYESLQYPLLYPHGTPGWHIGITDNNGKKLSQVKYYRRLLLSEPRFSNLGRLSEEWLVDMYCRVEEERLRFIFNMQKKNAAATLRTATFNELQDVTAGNDLRALATDETILGEGGALPGRVYLPNTFTNSQRYMKTKYMDGMSIVARLGKPSYFLTVTCNPKWPEITESTAPGTKPSASLLCRVFRLKLLELLRDIRSGSFFGKKVYLLYVIEFQKRGLPHSHICFRVEGGGPRQNVEIDKVVRAVIPSQDEAGGRLRKLVLTHMVHGPCGVQHRTDLPCWDSKIGKCSKHFPKPHNEVTHVDHHGFVHYKRDPNNTSEEMFRGKPVTVNDTWIVPYNAALLLKYDCHLNLEIASTRKIVKYLFKYITKGPDEARVAVVSEEDAQNEVETYATKRYIGACDAAWRTLEFEITGREPNVIQLPVHLEGQHTVLFRPGQESDALERSTSKLVFYFNRPESPEFDNLTYLEFFEKYLMHSKMPKGSNVYVTPHKDGTHFITARQRGEMVARLFWIAPNRGELFYLRLLLLHYPCRSYKDLKSLGGENCPTFQEAAKSLGLVNDELEYESALEEAHQFMTGSRLRPFFVLLLIAGARGAELWNKYCPILIEDLLDKCSQDTDKAKKLSLIEIERSLRRHGSTLLDHGLPYVRDDSTELGREILQHSIPQLSSFMNEWVPRLSTDQKAVFDHVLGLLSDNSRKIKGIFVDGPAGSGKTLLLNVVVAALRSRRCVVLCTATSGIAAQNYEGGMTAHSMFRLPLDTDNGNAIWGISGGSQRAELVRMASAIIFDEAPMAHKNLIHILDKSLRDLMQRNQAFGGKIVIFAGDFRQIPPVVPGARSPNDVVSASLRVSPLWNHLVKFQLSTAQRTRGDAAYSEFLLHVGNGNLSSVTYNSDQSKSQAYLIPLDNLNCTTQLGELINFVFPTSLLTDPDVCTKRAILCVTNDSVDSVNNAILRQLPGEPVHLLSVNYIEDTTNADELFLGPDALANIHVKGVPDHDLTLKPNTVCILVRNLHFDDGLLNGTKVIVVHISPRLIRVRKPGSDETFSIPRITFQASVEPGSPLQFFRRQFPLKLSYAMTVNKSQGQTIELVGVDLRSDVFCHGQLYVALGRVRSSENIRVLLPPERVIDNIPHTTNVVYPQLLHDKY